MKRKTLKVSVAATSLLLSGVMVSNLFLSNTMTVEAATLKGIEELITEVQTNAEGADAQKYTILEVVPDLKEAEIGYLFGGNEPVFSEYDTNTGKWTGWEEQLANAESDLKREEIITKTNEAYDTLDNEKKALFTEIIKDNTSGSCKIKVTKYGIFEKYSDTMPNGTDRYSLTFKEYAKPSVDGGGTAKTALFTTNTTVTEISNAENSALEHECVYEATPVEITKENISKIDSATLIYTVDETDNYTAVGSFAELETKIKEELNRAGESEGGAGADGTSEGPETGTDGTPDGPGTGTDGTSEGTGAGTDGTSEGNGTVTDGTSEETGTGTDGTSEGTGTDGTSEGTGTGTDKKDAVTEEKTNPKANKDTKSNNAEIEGQEISLNAGAELTSAQWLTQLNSVSENKFDDSIQKENQENKFDDSIQKENQENNQKNTLKVVDAPKKDAVDTVSSTVSHVKYYYYDFTVSKGDSTTSKKLYVVDTISYDPNGNYVFKEIIEEPLIGGQYYTYEKTVNNAVKFKNNELFKKHVLNMEGEEEYSKFPVQVITLTYEDLAKKDLPDFDFIYFKGSPVNDLDASKVIDLFRKINGEKIPCILDGKNLFDEKGLIKTSVNPIFFKFALMLSQETLGEMQFDKVTEEQLKNNMAAGYENGHFVTEHVYIAEKGQVLFSAFTEEINNKEGFQSVIKEIDLENKNRAEENLNLPLLVSKATTIRHIMNNKNRKALDVKKVINVLEIHPAYQDEKTIQTYLGKLIPEVEVVVKVMSTAEFNSTRESLNDKYDLIYIGSSTKYMNKNTDGSTIYNDEYLNGLIYHATGDSDIKIAANDTDTDRNNVNRYNGNDISQNRKLDLDKYIEAGYPVIVSDQLLLQNSAHGFDVNKNTVETGAALYQLLDKIKIQDGIKVLDNTFVENYIEGDLDKEKLIYYLNQPKIKIKNLNFTGRQDLTNNFYSIDKVGDSYQLEYSFFIDNVGSVKEEMTYSAELLFDLEGNGIYKTIPESVISEKNGSAVVNGELKKNTEYVLTQVLPSSYSGFIGTKVKVAQKDKPGVYATAPVFVELKDDLAKVKILQLGGLSEQTLDLEANLLLSSSPYYKKAMEIESKYEFEVEHCTLDEYKNHIRGNSLENIDKNVNYLNDYDVLLVGFFDNGVGIQDEDLLNPIRNYIAKGKSVVFTANTTEIQRAVLNNDIFKGDGDTYSKINIGKDSNYLYNLNDLNGNKTITGSKLLQEPNILKTNDGMITTYPFTAGIDFKIGASQGPDIRIDTSKPDITAWYCLDMQNDQHTMYSLSPNDGANNYYLYNQKNVFVTCFSGKDGCTEGEVELFFNTLVAGYHNSIKSPEIKVLETDSREALELTMIYRLFDENYDFDGTLTGGSEAEKIYFTVEDKNHGVDNLILSGRFLAANKASITNATEIIYKGAKIPVNYFGTGVVDAKTGIAVPTINNNSYKLENGGLYYVNVPQATLANCSKGLDLYFEVESTFDMGAKKGIKTDPSYSKVEVTRIYLFDLK